MFKGDMVWLKRPKVCPNCQQWELTPRTKKLGGQAWSNPRFGPVTLNEKGYPRIMTKQYRNKYLHRAVSETITGQPLPNGKVIHHNDADKLNARPWNLVIMPQVLHAREPVNRCPYTGRFLSAWGVEQIYGKRRTMAAVPEEDPPF